MEKIAEAQTAIHSQVSKLLTNYKKAGQDRLTKGYIKARMEIADTCWKTFEQQHFKLLSAGAEFKKSSEYFQQNIYDTCFDEYLDLKTRMEERLNDIEDNSSQTSVSKQQCNSVVDQSPGSSVKLPPIQLGTFSGDYKDWLSFRDLFKSLVHDNATLSKVNKCQYLKSCLRGEAENLVKQIAVSEVNYNIIWEMLNKRYNNKRSIVNTYMGKMFNQKRITSESVKSIRELLDVTTECLAVLKSLGLPTDSWDDLITYLIIQKLDPESHKMFEQRLESADHLPTWAELSSFLEYRFRTLEAVKPSQRENTHPRVVPPAKSFATEIKTERRILNCGYCKEDNHNTYNCKEFCKLDLEQRKQFVQNNQLCFNCLRKGHDVKSCLQSTSCRKCGRRHHSLLHGFVTTTSQSNSLPPIDPETVTTHSTFTKSYTEKQQVILATALINVQSQRDTNESHTLRALIDQGSQASLITESARQFLGFKKSPVEGTVMGVGSSTSVTKATVDFNMLIRGSSQSVIRVKAYVLKSLTSYIPQHTHSVEWPQLKELELADPTFQTPGKVDIILGADVFAEILQDGVMTLKNNKNTLIAQKTTLGWLISGRHTNTHHNKVNEVHVHHVKLDIDSMLQRFWELDEGLDKKLMTKEETQCEIHYKKTHLRLENGQYQVRMPFKNNPPDLGESLVLAKKRFQYLENKFQKNPGLHEKYNEFMKDYLDQNHMEPIPTKDIEKNQTVCYIPHHAVINEQHLTTKLRVVFDSSAKTSNGKSLNDNTMIGPPLQNDIRDVTLRWRRHQYVLIGDIRQMYRRINLDERDRDYLRILWRFNPEEEIQHYRLTTVTYGTSCAPYLALKTLRQLAEDERNNFEDQVIDTVLQDFYIDDLLTGEGSLDKVIQLKNDLVKLLQKGGFTLHKWASNIIGIEGVDQANRKILGINWNGHTDQFELKIELPPTTTETTKRTILCDIAKIYDPAGWLAPVVITAKSFLQKLWINKIDWDEYLPSSLLEDWLTFRNQLINMPTINLERWIGFTDDNVKVELHGFSDASTIAYAAVVYCKVITPDKVTVTMIEAKTRIAPVKQVSLPRLELCGAVLLAKLLHRVRQALSIPIQDTYAWTDATIVLAWLQKPPCCWTTFVANRVTEITNVIDKDRWNHVASLDNPADVASRGITPADLPDHPLWWHGPSWLRTRGTLPLVPSSCVEPTNLEEKVLVSVSVMPNISVNSETSETYKDTKLFEKYSSLSKLVRVVAFILRFYNCLKYKIKTKCVLECPSYLTTTDLKSAMLTLVKMSQSNNLQKEINCLKNGNKHCKSLYKLKRISPFLDEQDILRVKGRLCNATVHYNVKHPIILTKNCKLSYLIVQDAHLKTLHGGMQLMLNFICSNYHIIKVKYLIKQVIRMCVSCCRHSGKTNIQLMGDLPKFRVTPQRPFSISGVDLAGPVTLKLLNGRGSNRTQKAYIVLFICTAVKAIHLELVTSLSSEAFIAAFRRFTARRGHCTKLISDCGTNFIGASRQLNELSTNSLKNLPSEIAALLAQNGTDWQFNPASAPHMGGLWEANIKSVKRHLCRVLNDTKLTFEEYYTLLCQIECCLNSRPLTPVNDEIADVLTPGHFLIGESPNVILDENLIDVKVPYIQRWLYLQQKLQYFWKRWSQEYLQTLQNRSKWTSIQRNIAVNDIVLIKDERLPPAKWLLGKVIDTHPGTDGLTRVVSVKCKSMVLKRPIHKLCLITH